MFKKQALFADAENQGNKKNKENNKNNNTQTRCRRRKKKRKKQKGWDWGSGGVSGVQLDSTPTRGRLHNPSKNSPPCTHHNLWTKHAVVYWGRVQTLCLALTTGGGGGWDFCILMSAVFFLHHQCHWWKGSIQFCSMLPLTPLCFLFKILQDLSFSLKNKQTTTTRLLKQMKGGGRGGQA